MSITMDTIKGSNHSIGITDSTGANSLAVAADGSIAITDNGGSITVDGTVAIGSQAFVYAEDTAHTTADEGAFMLAVRQDTKASTAGTDGDYAALIQDADGDLYVSDTVAQGSLSTLAGAVSGSEMQVDIVAPLPSGTNNIGDVDILTMPSTQTEDAASAGGETLLMVGGYRQDTIGSPVSADGDFQGFIFNASGELRTSSVLDDVANSSMVVTTASVDTTAGGTNLVGTSLTNRRDVTVQNLGSNDIWIKQATGVTAGSGGNGFLLPKGSSLEKKWGDSIDLFAITASGTSSVKIIEAA